MKHVRQAICIFGVILLAMIQPADSLGNVPDAKAETTVYVTRTGSKYHTHKCGNGTYYAATLSEAKQRGLTACQKCFPGGAPSDTTGSTGSSGSTGTKTTSVKIKLNASSVVLVKGSTKKLKVKGGTGKITWKSSKRAVAKVSGSGKVTARKKGNATITATRSGKSAKCKVKVEEPKLTQNSLTLVLNDSKTLKLKGCGHKVSWSTSDDMVCDVTKGKLTPYEPGTATIKAKVHGKAFKCKVKVTAPKVSSFSLSATSVRMDTYLDDDYMLEILGIEEEWFRYLDVKVTSSNRNVVTADKQNGYVMLYAGAPGKADVTVTINGISRVCHVVVEE